MQSLQKYFDALAKKDFRCDLEPMRLSAASIGNPQWDYPTLHIVGTNGKGSAAAFLGSILSMAGLKVGLMTSPHLLDCTERIQVDHRPISWKELALLVEAIRPHLPDENFLSFFEMMTLAGFLHFRRKKVDIALIEAGMGGRLDATNLLKPEQVLVTPISPDHEAWLGNTLEQIAGEKCAVFKPGATVISAPQVPEVRGVIETKCRAWGLSLKWADPSAVCHPLGLAGEHQKTNAAVALLAAAEILQKGKLASVLPEALVKVRWPGRLQYLSRDPVLLVDGAHNRAGMEALAAYLEETHRHDKIHFWVGVLEDKDWRQMLEPLLPLAHQFSCITPCSPRALPAAALSAHFKALGKPAQAVEKIALPPLRRGEMSVATGSLYMVGQLLSLRTKTPLIHANFSEGP